VTDTCENERIEDVSFKNAVFRVTRLLGVRNAVSDDILEYFFPEP